MAADVPDLVVGSREARAELQHEQDGEAEFDDDVLEGVALRGSLGHESDHDEGYRERRHDELPRDLVIGEEPVVSVTDRIESRRCHRRRIAVATVREGGTRGPYAQPSN